MSELSAVEYDHDRKCYCAILADGEVIELDATNLSEAEREAQRIVDFANDELDNSLHEQR